MAVRIAKKSSRTLVREYDARVLYRVARAVVVLWVSLHRYARRRETAREVKERVLEILGGGVFEWCWRWKSVHNRAVSRDEAAVRAIYEHICAVEQAKGVASKCCLTISMISERMEALRKLAIRPGISRDEAALLWNGFDALRAALWCLFETGALAEMPNTPRMTGLNERSLEKLASVLFEPWQVLNRAAESSKMTARAIKLLGLALGLGIFNCVRSQEQKRAEIGVSGLIEWFERPQARRRRGFYAEIGLSLHELARLASELRKMLRSLAKGTDAWKAHHGAVNVLEITIYQVLATGILFSVPV